MAPSSVCTVMVLAVLPMIVPVTYIGDLETTSLEEVRIIAVTGEDPDTINDKHISFTVTGTIIGR